MSSAMFPHLLVRFLTSLDLCAFGSAVLPQPTSYFDPVSDRTRRQTATIFKIAACRSWRHLQNGSSRRGKRVRPPHRIEVFPPSLHRSTTPPGRRSMQWAELTHTPDSHFSTTAIISGRRCFCGFSASSCPLHPSCDCRVPIPSLLPAPPAPPNPSLPTLAPRSPLFLL